MATTDAYQEEISSQIPALQLLDVMGWQYLSPDEARCAGLLCSLDDIFYAVEKDRGVLFKAEQLDSMIEQVLEVAKARSDGRSHA